VSDENRCYDAALNLLAIRWHAEAEIRRKLKRRKFGEEEIADAMQRLRRENLLDDARYAGAYARSRLRSAFGRNRIAQELEQRGVSEATRRAAITGALEDEPERQHLEAACRKRLAQLMTRRDAGDTSAMRQKLVAHLVRKGFSLGDVFAVVNAQMRSVGTDLEDVTVEE
jgi:regulatory protein